MLFNSIDFFIFLIISFALYWGIFVKKIASQNIYLLVISYVFYGWWDWRFLFLIAFSSFIDYTSGLKISRSTSQKEKKRWLGLSLLVNLGFLGFFKYFNFFADSFSEAFNSIGYQFDALTLDIILPVGISFYTFQTMSYSIDVYRGKLEPCKDPVMFFAFVSFFPQLVAGPIERATNLLPQFYKKRRFDYDKAISGLKLILWGLFKKVVIADYCSIVVNSVFENYQDVSSSALILGAVCFAFQIYGDFSGYSDIAIGTARLFGFDLMTNFKMPYFARDIAEFWRKWHISLSTWFRDYLYIPLGGSKFGKWITLRNIAAIFLVSGFWHGANWTFIVWGAIHAVLYIPLFLFNLNRNNLDDQTGLLPSFKNMFSMAYTFISVTIAWVFFRAETVGSAFEYIGYMFTKPFGKIGVVGEATYNMWFIWIGLLIGLEWLSKNDQNPFLLIKKYKVALPIRYVIYILFIILVFTKYMENQQTEFIYFQF